MRASRSPAFFLGPALIAVMLFLPMWSGAQSSAAGANDTLAAVWTPKKVHFVYQGFTTHYSCGGLRDKVRSALLQLGARKDELKVTEGACTNPSGGPEPFPSVDVTMGVLQPLSANKADEKDQAVATHWQRIELKLDQDPLWEAGDCELLEQIKHTSLPLFATRAVDYQSACIARQLTPGGTWLKAEVLIADPKINSATK